MKLLIQQNPKDLILQITHEEFTEVFGEDSVTNNTRINLSAERWQSKISANVVKPMWSAEFPYELDPGSPEEPEST